MSIELQFLRHENEHYYFGRSPISQNNEYDVNSPPAKKLRFLPIKLIIQNCYNLKIQRSKFSTINSMHTRQSILYFRMVKIKNFKHIHVLKNIKVKKFIEKLHCQKVVGTWWVKATPWGKCCVKIKNKKNKNSICTFVGSCLKLLCWQRMQFGPLGVYYLVFCSIFDLFLLHNYSWNED